MGKMKVQPKSLGNTKGWLGGKNPITKYSPAALEGSNVVKSEDGSWPTRWIKASRNKGDPDIEIPEYQLPSKWDKSSGGLERRLLPPEVMDELDEESSRQPVRENTGFNPEHGHSMR
jgi:hypothetical protein